MNHNLLLLLNHKLTMSQETEAMKRHGITVFKYLPENLQHLWSNVPPDCETISEYLSPLKKWLINNSQVGDYILVEGDFGAVFIMVQYANTLGLVPIYSTTHRFAREYKLQDGSTELIHNFNHVRFRKYEVIQ